MPDQHYKNAPDGQQYYDKTAPTESKESIHDRCKALVSEPYHHFFDPVLPPVSQELTSVQRSVLGLKADVSLMPEEAQGSRLSSRIEWHYLSYYAQQIALSQK